MKYEVRHICPASLGKIFSSLGFIAASAYSAFVILVYLMSPKSAGLTMDATGNFGTGIGAVIGYYLIIPFLYALISMMAGFLSAWIYNGVSRLIGGITITMKNETGA